MFRDPDGIVRFAVDRQPKTFEQPSERSKSMNRVPTNQMPASEFARGLVEIEMNGQTVLCTPEKAEIYLKAKLHQERHPTVDFAAAVKAVGGR